MLQLHGRRYDTGEPIRLRVDGGRIAALRPAGEAAPAAGLTAIDQDGGEVWPGFVDVHTHLDKGHIWPRAENPDGSFGGAMAAADADKRANWSEDDVHARFAFGLRCAFAHGDRDAALAQAELLLAEIHRSGLQALPEPFRIFQLCWAVLGAMSDPRACDLPAIAHQRLSRRAQGIDDPSARARYQAQMQARWPVLGAHTPIEQP